MGAYYENTPNPIAPGSELSAAVHRGRSQTFVTVRGSCGAGHTMSLSEARLLRDWLIANIPTTGAELAAQSAISAQKYPEISEYKAS